MSEKLNLIKDYINELNLRIVSEDEKEELVVVDDPENGIQNLIIDCEPPLVVLEQLIFEVKSESVELYKRLLQMNRTLIHGSFVLDEAGKYVFFRDHQSMPYLWRWLKMEMNYWTLQKNKSRGGS
jgi:hypothetical protein